MEKNKIKHKTVSNTENAEKNQQATATSISGKSREKKRVQNRIQINNISIEQTPSNDQAWTVDVESDKPCVCVWYVAGRPLRGGN